MSAFRRHVTDCYNRPEPQQRAVSTASNRLLLAVVLLCAAAGCGSGTETRAGGASLLRAGDLHGWRAVPDAPGIGGLAPDLNGLDMTRRGATTALVRGGDAIRAAELVFATPKQAAEVVKRASGDDYQAALEAAFRGNTVRPEPGAGYRLRVARPTGEGADTVDVMLVRRGRRVVLLELVSASGFDPELRGRIVALVTR